MVKVGKKINGNADLRRFRTKEDGEAFKNEWNLKLAESNTPDLADLQEVTRHEVLAALAKLKLVGPTLTEAIDFFLRFGRRRRLAGSRSGYAASTSRAFPSCLGAASNHS